MRLIALPFLWSLLLCSDAFAQIAQVQCSNFHGMGYYANQGSALGADAGWHEDSMSGGEVVIRVDLDTGAADVRFKDATGIWQSVLDQGGSATLYAAQSEPESFMIVASYSASIEAFTVAEIGNGRARMIWTQTRATAHFANGRVMVGDCVATAF